MVGAGILGLAHAYVAAKAGKRVIVIDRDTQANGASVRNFGFVTVTGQAAGDCWNMAMRTRDIWNEIVGPANIEMLQRGMLIAAHLPESEAVIDAFLKTEAGQQCRRITAAEASSHVPCLRTGPLACALYSPHEIRVESRTAVALLARFLAEWHDVTFLWGESVVAVEPPRVITTRNIIEAEAAVVCPGDDFTGLYSERLSAYGLTRCKLQMLRVMPEKPVKLMTTVLSDLSVGRSAGYAHLPEMAALSARLDKDMPLHRENGIHLVIAQSADGSLVVGDSHHYAPTPDPFASSAVDELMLSELDRVLDLPGRMVQERWTGTYASASGNWRLTDTPSDAVRLVVVTSGCGASTCFGIAEETIDGLFGSLSRTRARSRQGAT
ncbi:TIGR03364 family FAD-dependent oxidoreductase [Mesorhizobium sp. A623]